ncbi:MAG: signal peptidase II [Bacteroidota bacterium]
MKLLKQRLPLIALAVAITVGLDQWTKVLAVNHLQGEPDLFYLNDMLRLTFVRNTGAFLSLGSELGPVLRPILLNLLPALLLIALLVYIFRERNLNRWQLVALALIVGGGLSNIVDRLLHGNVVDMLHLKAFGLQTGIFNVADMAIMAGMFMMLPFVFKKDPAPEANPEDQPEETVQVEA